MEYFGGDLVVWDFNDDDRVLDEIDLSLPLFLGGNIASSFFWFLPNHKSSPIDYTWSYYLSIFTAKISFPF